MSVPKDPRARIAVIATAVLITLMIAPFVGGEWISPGGLISGASGEATANIFWKIRVPRVCMAFLAGAALSLSGMAYQAIFRNTLATPFTLGVASGASLGAALYVWLGISLSLGFFSTQTLFAFAGAVLTVGAVYGLTRTRGHLSTTTMLLAGVAISFFISSVILFIQYLSDFTSSIRIMRWLMGGVDIVGYESVLQTLPFVAVGAVVIFYFANDLNLLTTGEQLALSRGVNVERNVTIMFFVTSLLIGCVVSVCGPIGFIGMMAPHMCRMLIGVEHRVLIPTTLLFGGAFLVVCDVLARTLVAPAEIPIGIITALIGGPFFLWLLLRRSPNGALG